MFEDNNPCMKIPSHMISDSDIDEKFFSLVTLLRCTCNSRGSLCTSIHRLVNSIGYTPNRNKGKINDVVKNMLIDLETQGYIFILDNLEKTKVNDCLEIRLNGKHEFWNTENPFTQFYLEDYEKIINTKTSVDKSRLIRIYLFIKKHLNTASWSEPFVFVCIRSIANGLNLSRGTNICQAIKELVACGVLYTYDVGSYIDKNGTRKNVTTYYAFEPDQFGGAYNHALEWVRSKGIEIDEFDSKVQKLGAI